MMTRRNMLAAGAGLAVAFGGFGALAADNPAATLRSFYDALLAVMKDGQKLGFDGRRQRLAPAIAQAFDLPLMTRLVVGPQWPSLSPEDQRQLVGAFTAFTIATYASQFDDYSGQRFQVDPTPAPAPGGDLTVKTKVIRSGGEPVQLDYLLRRDQGDWRIIDVFLSGTISQLAARRAEFTAILRKQGAAGLIASLKEKTQSLPNA
jgi:phospholipid transport system substrate-binding protein